LSPASQQGIAPLGVPSAAPAGPRPHQKKNRRRAVPVPLSLEEQQAMSGAAEPSPLNSQPKDQDGSIREAMALLFAHTEDTSDAAYGKHAESMVFNLSGQEMDKYIVANCSTTYRDHCPSDSSKAVRSSSNSI
jgi:hypothetical protein